MLERAAQSRSRLKVAVFTSIGISVIGLTAMLIGGQGCKREEPTPPPPLDSGTPPPPPPFVPTNTPVVTNPTPAPTNTPDIAPPPPVVPVTPVAPPPVAPPVTPVVEPTTGGQEYVIQKGDSFATLAKKFGVSPKAIEKANPGVDSRKLKIKQKINIPAPTAPTAPTAAGTATTPTTATAAAEGKTYVVQPGDSLYKIAKKHGVKIDALRKANNLTTDRIKVKQKLILPTKGAPVETAPTVPMVPPSGASPGPAAPTGTPPA